jgi:hypothetical protein
MTNFVDAWRPNEREKTYQPPAASTAVLEALRPRRGYETAKWLTELKSEVAQKSATQAAVGISESTQRLMNEWIESMFEHFEQFALDFNQSAAGTELVVTVTKPTFNYRIARTGTYHTESKITTFEGHLATRYWAMVVSGQYEQMQVNIVPTDILLGFLSGSFSKEEYPPFTEIQATWCDGQMCWQMDGHNLPHDMLDDLAGELFGDLIRVASGKMTDEELFSHHRTQKHSLGVTVATGVTAPGAVDRAASRAFDLQTLQLWETLQALGTAISNDLITLSTEETAALQSDNTAAKEQLREFADRLNTFRQKVSPLIADLQNLAKGQD